MKQARIRQFSCFYDKQQPDVCPLASAVNAKLNLSIIFEDQLAFLVGTFSQTGQLLKRPVVACCKPPWAFSERSHLWLLRPTDLR